MRRCGSGVHQCTGTLEAEAFKAGGIRGSLDPHPQSINDRRLCLLQRAARSSTPLRLAHPFSRVLLLYWFSKHHVALFAENPISAFRD